jgi:hypothetical protein
MPIYNAQTIASAVGSSTKDPEIAEWLKTGPVLGRHDWNFHRSYPLSK